MLKAAPISRYRVCRQVTRTAPLDPKWPRIEKEVSLSFLPPSDLMRCAKGIFANGIWGCTGFLPLRSEKGSETPSCDGEKGLRLPRSSCSDLGNEGVSDPFPHCKRESQTLFPTAKGETRTSQHPVSENPLSATHEDQAQLF